MTAPAADEHGRPSRARLLGPWGPFIPLALFLVLWVWLFGAEGAVSGGPNGTAFGADFAMFDAASQVLASGHNPYNRDRLYAYEQHMLSLQNVPITRNRPIVRVGNPPLFFWALGPLAALRFQFASLLWSFGLLAISVAACLGALRVAGVRRLFLPTAVCALMPQTVLAAFYGNPAGIVLAGLVGCLLVMNRFPVLAGACLVTAWLKPQVGLPAVLLILLFHVSRPRMTSAGLIVATALGAAVGIMTSGFGVWRAWLSGMLSYSRDVATTPDLASLSGLYVRNVPGAERTILEALLLLAAFALTILAAKDRRGAGLPVQRMAWLWFVWFLATPYAHFFDELLLVVPIAALLSPQALGPRSGLSLWIVYLAALSLLVLSWAPGGVQLLSIPVAAVLACAWLARSRLTLRLAP
ncbi:MAG: DUF2029 domain-containing protein [Chloroflexi bacterium]|nr:DUF2029 domain-containing protein [Chloroflexota bacterium]